jgi:hypothetical protein
MGGDCSLSVPYGQEQKRNNSLRRKAKQIQCLMALPITANAISGVISLDPPRPGMRYSRA